MKYYSIDFKIECSDDLFQISCDLIAEMAGNTGFESFEDAEKGIIGYVQTNMWNPMQLDECIHEFPIDNVQITYTKSEVADKDWNKEWENIGFEPINIDNNILVYDARHYDNILENEGNIKYKIGIEAIQAFGTGTHETTQMILKYLSTIDLTRKRVLDCGCGTGILGIVASKMGASFVTGYDIDEWSVKNAQHNATNNSVTNMEVMYGNVKVLSQINGFFDIIMANINRNILLNDMHEFFKVLNHDGILIISGFYEDDITILLDKAHSLGMIEIDRNINNHWTQLAFKVKNK